MATKKVPKLTKERFRDAFDRIVANVETVIRGKTEVVRLALVALVAEGHVLFEDAPGTGKTMLSRSIARSVDALATRIQCTPDLLPADVSGSPVLDRKSGSFVFRHGPIFGNVVLADEINRATPKTQSAFLEAMQERNVTVDSVTYPLPSPFFVLATQNPIELSGTFPLPEAQLDRFMFKLSLGYPARDAEKAIVRSNERDQSITALEPVVGLDELRAMIEWAAGVTISDGVLSYIVDVCAATRDESALQLGASTRAPIALARAARAAAASRGRDDVLPDDVRDLVAPVLAHRLILSPDAMLRDDSVEQVIERVLGRVKVPLGAG